MKISVILAHPNPESFNAAIAKAVLEQLDSNSNEICFHDLYQEKFDPVLCHPEFPKDAEIPLVIEMHCREISVADGIVIIHPNWWGQPPAILKGWMDRVLRPGVAYQFEEGDSGEGIPVGLLKAKTALVLNTSNTNARREVSVFGDPLERIWKNCIFDLCGIKIVHRRTFQTIVTSTLQQRQQWLAEVKNLVRQLFPRDPPPA